MIAQMEFANEYMRSDFTISCDDCSSYFFVKFEGLEREHSQTSEPYDVTSFVLCESKACNPKIELLLLLLYSANNETYPEGWRSKHNFFLFRHGLSNMLSD